QNRKPYSEFWYYLSVNEAGAVIISHFSLAKINLFFEQFTVDFGIYLPDGTTHYYSQSYVRSEVESESDRFHIKLRENTLGGTLESQRLQIKDDNVAVDLRFDSEVPAYRDGDGRIYLDKGKQDYMDVTYQPAMRVEGDITIGEQRIQWRGWGYADHVRQTFIPTEFAGRLYAFRVKMGDLFISSLDYFTNPGIQPRRLPSLMVTYKDRIIHVGHDYHLEETATYEDSERGISVPSGFRLSGKSGTFEISCSVVGKLLQRVDLLSTMGTFKRSILSFAGVSSFDYIFSEDVECRVASSEVSGLFSGKGVLEVVQ
ncbi:MAG: lipocalin-like domain-containing protein, partial [Sedimenticola sp.]